MSGEEQGVLGSVVLCYQSMGLALDAPPPVVEQKFKTLAEGYRKKLTDPACRVEAQRELEVLEEMYDKIRRSISYQTAERDYQKKVEADQAPAEPAQPVKPVHDVVAQRGVMTLCPHCNGSIVIGTRDCPICKKTIYTTGEKIAALFTRKNIIIAAVVVALLTVGVLCFTHPWSNDTPEPDIFEKGK